jgi:protein TonB
MEEMGKRLAYRNSPQVVRFAWKSVLLSLLFGSLFFILIPLTSRLDPPEEKTLTLRKAPERIEITPEEEIIEKIKPEPVEQEVPQEVQPLTPPQVDPPPAVPIKIEISAAPSAVRLDMQSDFQTDLNFEVESIAATGREVISDAPQIHQPGTAGINYNGIFAEGDVDRAARRLNHRQPRYPTRARRRGISGKVVISCVIGKDGIIHSPQVIEAQPPGYFEDACLATLSDQRYEPASKGGKPVAQRALLTFEFGLQK